MNQRVLVIGYGNPGRLDDGLGPALAAMLEECGLENVEIDSDYQLTVENAAQAAEVGLVVFADASTSCQEPFEFYPVEPEINLSFSSHHVSAEVVIGLARDLFLSCPDAYMLSIRGYEFDRFGECLSKQAQDNLGSAVEFVDSFIRQRLEINAAGVVKKGVLL